MTPEQALIVGALISAVGIVVGSLMTNLITAKLQREERGHAEKMESDRWDRQQRVRQEDLEREARRRWADERRQLYGQYIRNVDEVVDGARAIADGRTASPGLTAKCDDVYQLSIEISMLAPAISERADKLFLELSALLKRSRSPEERARPWEEREKEFGDAYSDFVVAAQKDLAP